MQQVRDINWRNPKYIRAGFLPVTTINDVTFFAFGVENGVAALGDFGGHVERKDYDVLDSAIREYQEEALEVFGKLNRQMLQDCYVLDGIDTIEILLPVNQPLFYYSERFYHLIKDNNRHEVQSIVWLTRDQVLQAINEPERSYRGTKVFHMYNRIRDTLYINKHFL